MWPVTGIFERSAFSLSFQVSYFIACSSFNSAFMSGCKHKIRKQWTNLCLNEPGVVDSQKRRPSFAPGCFKASDVQREVNGVYIQFVRKSRAVTLCPVSSQASWATPRSNECKTLFFFYATWRWANDVRKCIMKCQITDFVDNRLCGYLWHFLLVCLYTWQTASSLHANNLELSRNWMVDYVDSLPNVGISLVTHEIHLCRSNAVLLKLLFFFLIHKPFTFCTCYLCGPAHA